MNLVERIRQGGMHAALHAAVLSYGLSLGGCALLSKTEPLMPRYFTLDDTAPTATAQPASSPPANASQLHLALGRVASGALLRERILFRNGAHEVSFYNDRRWTERPDGFLRRALERSLFERRGVTRVLSGAAPLLQVELVMFEEVRGEEPRVRMQVVIALEDGKTLRLRETITVQQPIAEVEDDEHASAVVAAFAAALHACVEEIAERVVAELAVRRGADYRGRLPPRQPSAPSTPLP